MGSIIMGAVLYALPYLIKGYHENRLEKLKAKDIVAPEIVSIQEKAEPILTSFTLGEMLAEHKAKLGVFGCHSHVTTQWKGHSDTNSCSVQCGNHRLC